MHIGSTNPDLDFPALPDSQPVDQPRSYSGQSLDAIVKCRVLCLVAWVLFWETDGHARLADLLRAFTQPADALDHLAGVSWSGRT